MQKSRRWRGLEFKLLPVGLLTVACAAPVSRPSAIVVTSPRPEQRLVTADGRTSEPPGAATELPKGTLVLQIGDSFAGALGVDLGRKLHAVGVHSALEYKTASYIPNWSFGPEIPEYLGKYHPSLVLVTLGANELEIANPEQRARAIRHLVSSLGGRPCVWVAPPLWKPDTGLLRVIQDNVAPCRYLDSNALVHDLPRGRDKIHPNAEGREIWAQIVFDWLRRERVGSQRQPWALRAAHTRTTSRVSR